jgi:hypothetical protein
MLYSKRVLLLIPKHMSKFIVRLIRPFGTSFDMLDGGNGIDGSLEFTIFTSKAS